MNKEEFDQYLEIQSNNLSEEEFFALIIKLLEDARSQETREVLESYLMAYSFVNEDRAARYWEMFLSASDAVEREDAALRLSMLAGGPGSLAYKILADFLGEEPQQEKIKVIFKERFLRLFPR